LTVPELDEELARTLLQGHGLVDGALPVEVRPLGGGVSSVVLWAGADGRAFVLKQPREEFRVEDRWIVDARRLGVEHAFARAVGGLLEPGDLAPVVGYAPQLRVLIFQALPRSWTSWKGRLLQGDVDSRLGAAAGRLLSRVHAAGERPELRGRFHHPDLFDQQRLDPYFRTSAERVPQLRDALERLIHAVGERQDLVHGDFSPKNLLTDGQRIVLIDHEVATRGDAAFDLAFLLTHLCLKSIHRPMDAARLAETAREFLAAYGLPPEDRDRPRRALSFLGGLLVARAVGKSRAEYLDPAGRAAVLELGTRLLEDPVAAWDDVEDRILETNALPPG
jgi:hypothetical protein